MGKEEEENGFAQGRDIGGGRASAACSNDPGRSSLQIPQ
jgi:hypothetical protein